MFGAAPCRAELGEDPLDVDALDRRVTTGLMSRSVTFGEVADIAVSDASPRPRATARALAAKRREALAHSELRATERMLVRHDWQSLAGVVGTCSYSVIQPPVAP